jgi:uncharacterized protein YaiI (UPF0178 family)
MSDFTIWVDADATPRPIKDVLFNASERRKLRLVLVANSWMRHPTYGLVEFIQVAEGPDVADDYIAEQAQAGDLVITQDVPLAARVVPKGAAVIQPNGRELDQDSVDEALAMRDFKESLRESGTMTGGPPPFGPKQKQQFSNALDRWITRRG